MSEEELRCEFLTNIEKQEREEAVFPYSLVGYASGGNNVYINDMFDGVIHPYHYHSFFEINYVMSGVCHEYIEGKMHTLNAGDFVMLPSGVRHTFYASTGTVAFNVLLRPAFVEKMERDFSVHTLQSFLTSLMKTSQYAVFFSGGNRLITEVFRYLHSVGYQHLESFTVEGAVCEKTVETLFLYLITLLKNDEIRCVSEAFSIQSYDFDSQLLKYIEDHFATLTLESFAAAFGYTPKGLYRKLKRMTGKTYQMLVDERRLSFARKMLELTDQTVGGIAEKTGFKNAEYFSRFFKKRVGMSPVEFRKTYLEHGKDHRFMAKDYFIQKNGENLSESEENDIN